ncbi:MAG: chemotaxis response regulator protein-glutamate methylesterase [Methylocystaceae bacterium]|nr:chemotaxis response regulator protein-glutamate methylesterase [Methylocystaceae bacterium]
MSDIKVLVVDDSALIRQLLTTILQSDPAITVVGAAQDAHRAREMIKKHNPDVITLDVEMPKMNGIDFLKKIMSLRPMPVVMVSSLTQSGADITFEALEIGAIDFVSKPQHDLQHGMQNLSQEIITKVKTAATAKISPFEGHLNPQPILAPVKDENCGHKKLVVIGASTGGVEALRMVLQPLPKEMPPIFVVQHMPKQFTGTFAKRLNSLCRLNVIEAEDGMVAEKGHVYIAPGDKHLLVKEVNSHLTCRLQDGQEVGGHIPSVGVLFDSAATVCAKDCVGVMLSGMGKDGADAMLRLKEGGAYNLGQNEKTCVVYGMPKVAFERGAVDLELDVSKIAPTLMKLCCGVT